MNISTTSRHYELPAALRDYAEGKVQNLKKYFDHIVNARLIFTLEKYRHKVEITLHVNGKDFVGIEESDDMYVSVDRSVEKLERQLKKHKEKIRSRKSYQSVSDVISSGEEAVDEEESGSWPEDDLREQ
ncbi:MAG: ribosome-associated translation inhibitor RaiA [Candidatus Krumholzibacteria bacterium]|nr:ribosome-associated translation inhibitor RaiA [Candidatus Krumholzibacteria bacterium]